MKTAHASSVIAGLIAGFLFFTVGALHLGFLFMLLPSLPLFYLGLSQGIRPMLTATITASLCIFLAGGLNGVLFFLLFAAWPAAQLAHDATLCRQPANASGTACEWFPIGLSFVRLTGVAAVLMLAASFYFSTQGGMDSVLQESIRTSVQELEPELQQAMLGLSSSIAFVVIAASLWMWLLLIYIHGWVAQKMLMKKKRALRPDFALTPFAMPRWMLVALTLSGLASLVGSASLAFTGKVLLILLLFPYFLLGLALIHEKTRTMPSRGFLLFMLYFFLMAQAWPAMVIAGYGVWHQCRDMATPGNQTT